MFKRKYFLLVFVLILFLVSCTPTTPKEEIIVEEVNLKGMSPEQVLEFFLSYFNYNGIAERTSNLISEQQMAEGFQLESLKSSEDYFRQLKLLNQEWIEVCAEAKRVGGEDVCGEVGQYGPWGRIKRDFQVLSKERIEETDNLVKIKIKYRMIFENHPDDVQDSTGETTYFLKKYEGIWKIYDGINENGELFSSKNLQQQKQDNNKIIKEQQDSLNKIKRSIKVEELIGEEESETSAKTTTTSQNNKIVETSDYTVTLSINKGSEYCNTNEIQRNWCSDYDEKWTSVKFSFFLKPKKEFSGGPSAMSAYVFNENGDSLRLVSSGFGGGMFNWWDGWRNYYFYSAYEFKEELPETAKLIIVYGEGNRMVGKSLEELKNSPIKFNTPNIFTIDYQEIQDLPEE